MTVWSISNTSCPVHARAHAAVPHALCSAACSPKSRLQRPADVAQSSSDAARVEGHVLVISQQAQLALLGAIHNARGAMAATTGCWVPGCHIHLILQGGQHAHHLHIAHPSKTQRRQVPHTSRDQICRCKEKINSCCCSHQGRQNTISADQQIQGQLTGTPPTLCALV